MIIWAIWRGYKWVLLHPQNYESAYFIIYLGIQMIYEVLQIWANLTFWFLFLCCFVWFVSIKLTTAFYVLPPDYNDWYGNFRTFEIMFGCMVCIKMIILAFDIYTQCNVDIFFLDREYRKGDPALSPNAWRLIFVANEYNEMQSMKYVNIELTLFWFVFFIHAEGWVNWTNYNSKLESTTDYSFYNNELKYCVFIMVMIGIAAVQYLMKILLSFIFPLPYQNFVDLCSIANISVFIFDQRIHGYYIHGESTGGQADVSTRDLKENLDNETMGESRNRGMLSQEPNLQTFEIFLPVKIRQIYEVVYKQNVLNEISTYRDNLSAIQNSSKLLTLSPLPKGLNIQSLVNQRDEMSQYFINYISQVKNYPHLAVKERGICQLFSNLPPDRIKNMETPLFFKDKWYRFKNVFFCSLDFDILMLLH